MDPLEEGTPLDFEPKEDLVVTPQTQKLSPVSTSTSPDVTIVLHEEEQHVGKGEKEDDYAGFEDALGDMFNTKQPRDLTNGLAHAASNVSTGIGVGIGGLFAAPIMGATQDGVTGFIRGLGVGVFGAVAAPIAGVSAGIAQIVRGAAAQSEANAAQGQGKVWDKESRTWVTEPIISLDDYLEQATAKLLQDEKTHDSYQKTSGRKSGASSSVKETDFYDILEVAPGPATDGDMIKKAYRKQAIRYHPDKNRDDPNASAKFQEISAAYTVLSDPASRANYDKNGRKACDSTPMMNFDPGYLFDLIFGSEALNPFIGEEFRISTILSSVLTGGMMENPDEDAIKELLSSCLDGNQDVRYLKIAIFLRGLVDQRVQTMRFDILRQKAKKNPVKYKAEFDKYNSSEKQPDNSSEIHAKWETHIRELANAIVKEKFGKLYLEALGDAYEVGSSQLKSNANIIGSTYSSLTGGWKNTTAMFDSANRVIKLLKKFQEINIVERKLSECEDVSESQNLMKDMAEKHNKLMADAIEFAVCLNLMDITSAVKGAVEMCCKKDTSIPLYERQLRADAIDMIGQIFLNVAKNHEHQELAVGTDIERHIETAFLKAIQKRDGEDYQE